APFVIHIVTPPCFSAGGVTVNATNIDVNVSEINCIDPLPPNSFDRTVGPLAAGNYTIRLLLTTNNNSVITTAPVTIGADIPTLDPRVLAMLAVTLVGVAIFRLRVR